METTKTKSIGNYQKAKNQFEAMINGSTIAEMETFLDRLLKERDRRNLVERKEVVCQ